MEPPREPHREMTDPKNRYILGTFNVKTICCAQRSIARARFFDFKEKEERILDFLMQTAGIEGRGREDLRDALMGARAAPLALGATQPTASVRGANRNGVPSL